MNEVAREIEIAGVPCLRLTVANEQGAPRLTQALGRQWLTAIERTADKVHFVILSGPEEQSFCEGLDLDVLLPHLGTPAFRDAVYTNFAEYVDLLRFFQRLPCPLISVVGGPALGGGVGLAAVSDLVLAAPRVRFSLPEALYGLFPAGVFPVLARRIGVARTRLLAMGGKPLSATEAWQLGLVDEVVDDPATALSSHVQRMARMDPRSIKIVKQLAMEQYPPTVTYWEAATTHLYELLESTATQERLQRFLSGDTPWPEEKQRDE